MKSLEVNSLSSYLEILDTSLEQVELFEACMRVTISRFYRDRVVWEILENEILPELKTHFPSGLNVWSIGCGCGEEIYSAAMLLDLHWPTGKHHFLATDIDGTCLDRAQKGYFGKSSLRELPPNCFHHYFTKVPGQKSYEIQPELKENIRWLKHDFFSEAPVAQKYQLMFLRNNLLTYFQGKNLTKTLARIAPQLQQGGYLIVGRNEQLAPLPGCKFEPHNSCHFLYKLLQ